MTKNKMTQSEIDALLKDSDLDDSVYKDSLGESGFNNKSRVVEGGFQHYGQEDESHQEYEQSPQYQQPHRKITQTSNQYGEEEFEDYQSSKMTQFIMNKQNNLNAKNKPNDGKSSAYDSYAQEQFQSYQQSRRTKEFERSLQNVKINNNNNKNINNNNNKTKQQLNAINQYEGNTYNIAVKSNDRKSVSFQEQNQQNQPNFNKNKQTNLIKTPTNVNNNQPTSTTNPKNLIRTQQSIKNMPYNYQRLQQRQRELLFTTITEENKKLKHLLSQRDKQLSQIKMKYNILLQEKAQVLGNVKQATLKKQLQLLQTKYDSVVKQKIKQRAYKTAQMSKTMTNNFILQQQAQERQQQLLVIIQKLKQRLVSTDKQLKTLHQKMNEGLDYQQELKRKLKRVEQLEMRMQKMKSQAEEDRGLIEILKQKTNQQKTRIQELQQEKNQMSLCLKRAQMTQATQSDLRHQLEEARRQKELLQQSLKDISMNFTNNLFGTNNNKRPKLPDAIEDSNQLLSYNNNNSKKK